MNEDLENEQLLDLSDYDSESDSENEKNCNKRSLESDDEPYEDFEQKENKDFNKYSFDQMEQIASYSQLNNGKTRIFTSMKNRFRTLTDRKELHRIRQYVKNGDKYSQKVKVLEEFVYLKFQNARLNNFPVHDINIRQWALKKSKELNFKFKASDSWIYNFKKKFKIRFRKICKYVTFKVDNENIKVAEASKDFVNLAKDLFVNYNINHIVG
jgi:hypothetical protein